jgi:hypothetical protein
VAGFPSVSRFVAKKSQPNQAAVEIVLAAVDGSPDQFEARPVDFDYVS